MKNIWSGLQKIVMLGASMLSWRDRYLRPNEHEEFLSSQLPNQRWTCQSSCGRYRIYFLCYVKTLTFICLTSFSIQHEDLFKFRI